MNTVWQFATAAGIKFGRGCRTLVVDELRKRALKRVLVVSDPNIVNLPVVVQVLDSLSREFQVSVFDGGRAEPAIDVALSAIEVGTSSKSDCVIGIGGGSNLDVAKVAATVLKHGGAPSDYFGFDCIPNAVLPVMALPTTAGTGSEVSHSAVLTDTANEIKVSTLSSWLRPTCAFVDPELTDSCPRNVTAESGIDVLVHAIEAYTNRGYTEMGGR